MQKIFLRPMNEAEYRTWQGPAFAQYAEEKEKSGLSPEEAQKEADSSFKNLLPLGKESPHQYLYAIMEVSSQSMIGNLWWGVKNPETHPLPWIYDIFLDPARRGKGYGQLAMELAEEDVKAKGYKRLGLHVFGHNDVALKLYRKLGFAPSSIVMQKSL